MHDPRMSVLKSMDAHGRSAEGGGTSAAESLCDLQRRISEDSVPLGQILDSLGTGATGIFMLLIGAAALVPGTAPVFGIVLCLIALSLIAGRKVPWLPPWLRRRRISRDDLHGITARVVPRLRWLERRLRPRQQYLLRGPMLRLLGLACLSNGVLIVLPIPFGNTAPALAAILLALGLATGDGLIALAGLFLSVIAVAVGAGLIFLGYEAFSSLLALLN